MIKCNSKHLYITYLVKVKCLRRLVKIENCPQRLPLLCKSSFMVMRLKACENNFYFSICYKTNISVISSRTDWILLCCVLFFLHLWNFSMHVKRVNAKKLRRKMGKILKEREREREREFLNIIEWSTLWNVSSSVNIKKLQPLMGVFFFFVT